MRRYSLRVPAAEAEQAMLRMLELFPDGIEEEPAGDQVVLSGYAERAPAPGLEEAVVEEGWEDNWRAFHRPVRQGRLWVGPPWFDPEPLAVVIDPGRAFGTGAHGSTRAALELLQTLEPSPALDLGCGSGVLSIAAARLGFGPLQAFDIDPLAVQATRRECGSKRRRARGRRLRRAGRSASTGAAVAGQPRAAPAAAAARAQRPATAAAGIGPARAADRGRRPAGGGRRLGGRAGGAVTRHRYRFFARSAERGLAHLSDSDRRHLSQVLRLRVGDTCEVVCGGPGLAGADRPRGMRADRGGDSGGDGAGDHGLDRAAGRALGRGGREADRARRRAHRRAAQRAAEGRLPDVAAGALAARGRGRRQAVEAGARARGAGSRQTTPTSSRPRRWY